MAGAGEQGGGRLANESCVLGHFRSRENGETSNAAMTNIGVWVALMRGNAQSEVVSKVQAA